MRKRWANLTIHGKTSAVLREMRSEGKALLDEKGLKELKSKFPEGKPVESDPDISDPNKFEPLEFNGREIMKALGELRKRSGGIDHWTGENLLNIARQSDTVVEYLTNIINSYSKGAVPREIIANIPIRGVALKKNGGGVRPISVPPILEGLTTKAATLKSKKKIKEVMKKICPTQLALAPRGAEIAAHIVRDYIDANSEVGKKKVAALIDLANCFNNLNRENFVALIKKDFPELYPYINLVYAGERQTIYGGEIIRITRGLLQGCGHGPLLCGLGLGALINMAQSVLSKFDPESSNVSFMDDMTYLGDERGAVNATKCIADNGPEKYGAEINAPKTIMVALDPMNKEPEERFPNAKRIIMAERDGFDVGSQREDSGTRLLGSPIGSKEFCVKYLQNRFKEKYESYFTEILSMNNPTVAWRLYQRLSVNGGLTHVFRSTPPHLIAEALPDIEKKMRKFVSIAIFGRALTEMEWNICQLPFSMGGWNFTPLDVLSPCAYLASLLANRTAVLELRPLAAEKYDSQIRQTTELILKNDPSAKLPQLNEETKQKDLVRAVMESRFDTLHAKADVRTKALLLGGKQPHANLWKTAEHTPETAMDPKSFRFAALFSIGGHFSDSEWKCPECDKMMDVHGDHALICAKTGTIVHRHNDVATLFVKEAREALITVDAEKRIFNGHNNYDADFVFGNGIPTLDISKRPAAFDVTVSCNFNKTAIKTAAEKELSTAQHAEDGKERLHKKLVETAGYLFVPLAFETTGGHCPIVAKVIHYILSEKALMTRIPFEELSSRFWSLLSVKLQTANARAIFSRAMVLSKEMM